MLARILCLTALALSSQGAWGQGAAEIIHPYNGATEVDAAGAISWTPVTEAHAYYLYVGTTSGAKDIVNSGEIHATQWPLASLPLGRQLYARVHTLAGGAWRYREVTFTLRPVARFRSPANGEREFDVRADTISWSGVDGADAYFLYVGTQPGLRDLISSGETLKTVLSGQNLPVGTQVYARLHTKFAGKWRSVDSSFVTRPVAYLISPSGAGQGLEVGIEKFVWTTVPDAEAYYLYVGTAPGAKDVIDSHEVSRTDYPSSVLPKGATLHARLFTKHGGVWRATDRSFTTRATASFTSPALPDAELDVRADVVSWNAYQGAQAYFLYLGTAPGKRDLLSTGETQRTAFSIRSLPVGMTVYARLHTKANGKWQFVDSRFLSRPVAYFEAPADGAMNLDTSQDGTWTSVPGAQAYFLYAGSAPGASDYISSGEMLETRHELESLPGGASVHLTLHTLWGGKWRSVASVVRTSSLARLNPPPGGIASVDPTIGRLQWNPVLGADSYRVQIGSSVGANDVFDSGTLSGTSSDVPPLAGNASLYVRISTLVDGSWVFTDTQVRTRPVSTLTSPALGERGVPAGLNAQWMPVVGATRYRLLLGSSQGSSNMFDSGPIAALSAALDGLPAEGPIFTRVMAELGGVWTRSDSVFTRETSQRVPVLLSPAPQDGILDSDYGLEWDTDPLARSYELRIGTAAGSADVLGPHQLRAERMILRGLQSGTRYFARLTKELLDGERVTNDFTFIADETEPAAAAEVRLATWAAARVRAMAASDNVPARGSLLYDATFSFARVDESNCSNYAHALLAMNSELALLNPMRRQGICLQNNAFDCHTLVEVEDRESGRWQIIDPTFALAVWHAETGEPTSVQALHESVRALDWTGMEFEFLSDVGDAYVRSYYLDYPLLFANIVAAGAQPSDPYPSAMAYYELIGSSASQRGTYAIRCAASQSQVTAWIDGMRRTLLCSGIDRITSAFVASEILPDVSAGSTLEIYAPLRPVFGQ